MLVLGAGLGFDERPRAALAGLRRRGLLETGDDRRLADAGTAARDRVQVARCEGLESLVADWRPESPELDAAIARLSEELGQTARLSSAVEPEALTRG